MMRTAFFAVVLSIVPGLYAFWTSQKALKWRDDPLFPDRLLARGQRVNACLATALGVGVVLARPYLGYILFASIVGVLAGGFPARKKIFDETWSFAGYLSHTVRFWLGMLLALLLIASIPTAMRLAGEHALAVGIGVGALALLYATLSSVLFPRFVLATTLSTPELETPFTSILAKARCPRPILLEAEARGGSWVNAFALPSFHTPTVVFTAGLLRELEPRETSAILAHELAHLEHHTHARLVLGLISMAIMVAVPISLWAGPWSESVRGFEWVWPVVLLLFLAARARRRQAHEEESDLRAVELCGDAEALIAGLTKIHALMRVPRRWSEQHDRWSSHPSLSRRIAVVRRAHVKEAEPIQPVTFLAGDSSGRAVVLDAEKLHFLTGVPPHASEALSAADERRSIRYSDLGELRLAGDPRRLLVKDASRRTMKIALREEDVSQLSSLLDRVDVQIQHRRALPNGRIASLVVALFALSPFSAWTVALLGMLAAAIPSQATLAAAGVSGLVSVAHALRAGLDSAWSLGAMATASVFCLAVATMRLCKRRAQSIRDVSLAVAVPAVCVIAGLAAASGVFVSPLPAMKLHLWARESLGVVAGLAAIASSLATVPGARQRLGAILAASLSAAVFLSGSMGFGRRFGGDAFARIAPEMNVLAVAIAKVREVSLDGAVQDLMLSPEGSHFYALVSTDEGENYLLETPNGVERVDALALDFVDDRRVAAVTLDGGRAVLKLISFQIGLPSVQSLDLTVDARSGRWQILGLDPESYDTVVFRGHVSSASFDEIRFRTESDAIGVIGAVSYEGAAIQYDYAFAEWESSTMLRLATALDPRDVATRFSMRLGEKQIELIGTTLLDAFCFVGSLTDFGFLCSVQYGRRTSLFSIDPEFRELAPIGSVSGFYHVDDRIRDSRLVLGGERGASVLVDLETNVAIRPPLDGGRVLAWRNDVLAAATTDDTGTRSTVTLYRLVGAPR